MAAKTTPTPTPVNKKSPDVTVTDEDALLSPPYKLLSTNPSAPRTVLLSRTKDSSDINRRFVPGPGTYDPNPSPTWRSNGSPRMVKSTTLSLKEAVPPPPMYDLPPAAFPVVAAIEAERKGRPVVGVKKGFSLYSRGKESTAKLDTPAPGTYDVPGAFPPARPRPPPPKPKGQKHEVKTPRTYRSGHIGCTFGAPLQKERANMNPGPGAYEQGPVVLPSPLGVAIKRGVAAGASVKGKPRPLLERRAPGPGEYDIPSTFGAKGAGPTLKGRLPHPMEDSNAAHEAAKTSSFRSSDRKMKGAPRLK